MNYRIRYLGYLAPAIIALTAGGQVFADPGAEMMANTCAGCHGTHGKSAGPASPNLAGLSESYFTETMLGFREGTRPATIMDRIAKGYTNEQIESMATYFAALPVYKANVPHDVAKAKAGAEIYESGCAKCHDEGGSLPGDDAGILAGQWLPWLQYSMADYKAGHREMTKKMKKAVEKLSDTELEAVLHYFASQQ
ncbi:MAG TPA: c-type cytochrome [Gammaproteobacteria bacterium]|nr:c-type cytochrome [Chromatiales bacterium]HPE81460.1 c-type cytochrome [Gammaproteobacteria bacterium]HPQ26086.1 c-type cytochrome [Gammaproteobacteria bacterium]